MGETNADDDEVNGYVHSDEDTECWLPVPLLLLPLANIN
jgi:hypothetical protein